MKDDLIKYHRLDLDDPIFKEIVCSPEKFGISKQSLDGKNGKEEIALIIGRYFEQVAQYAKGLSSELLEQFTNLPPVPQVYKSETSLVRDLQKPLRCVFLNTYYDAFLTSVYRSNPSLPTQSYQSQLQHLISQCFGDSDFYSKGLINLGWDTHEIIVNCTPLQTAWARENNVTGSNIEIALAQIRNLKPDVVYSQDMHHLSAEMLAAIRPHTRLLVGQIASSAGDIPIKSYDIVFSSFIQFVEWFRSLGISSYFTPLAFDERVLNQAPSLPFDQRTIACSFLGGIASSSHQARHQFLSTLAQELPIDIWGYGIDQVPADSPIRAHFRGEAWGVEMFKILGNSKITVNIHADHKGCGGPMVRNKEESVTRFHANNMRLFEATGCGALLITEYKNNLSDFFEIGKEVVAYRTTEECIALTKYYMQNPDEAAAIARAGQARTLKEHTYVLRMKSIGEFLERHIRYQSEQDRLGKVDFDNISSGYQAIEQNQISPALANAWHDTSMPRKQRALVQSELQKMYHGDSPEVFKALAEAIRPYSKNGTSLLEIGCSSGYYSEILKYLVHRDLKYVGVDLSEAMIEMAKQYYPNETFHIADGVKLPLPDSSFDVVVSSCVLLHTPNYHEQIRETLRVAKNTVIAHRTPVCRTRPTQYLKKLAYGVETVELRFNEKEFIECFESRGFVLTKSINIDQQGPSDEYCITYVFNKRRDATYPSHALKQPNLYSSVSQ